MVCYNYVKRLTSVICIIYCVNKKRDVNMGKRTTIKDIAEATGLSIATVSNVINGINKVSEENRQLVLKTMKELDYHPNLAARSLSRNRSDMIGLLLPLTEVDADIGFMLRDNPFYGELVSAVEYKATELGYDVLIKGVRPGESCRDWVLKRNLDGVIFIGNDTNVISKEMKELESQLVLVDAYDEGVKQHSTISIDDRQGGYIATKHLLDLGHRNIAIAASNILPEGVIQRRFQGYKDALESRGIQVKSEYIFQDSLSFDGGYRIGKKLLKHSNEITAVFAAADVVAFGIIKAFNESSKKIPENLSIIGFDNTKTCEFLNPALTSIAQPIYEKGIKAVEILVDLIYNSNSEIRKITLPVKLVERDSTCRIS